MKAECRQGDYLRASAHGAQRLLARVGDNLACSALAKSGGAIGQKWHSKHFQMSVEQASQRLAVQLVRERVSLVVPALGIPSDFSVIFDGGTVGAPQKATRDPQLVIGLGLTCAITGHTEDVFVDCRP